MLPRHVQRYCNTCHNILPDMTDVTIIIATEFRCYIYLSFHGQRCITIHTQILHQRSYIGSSFTKLKLNFFTHFQLTFQLTYNQFCLLWFNISIFTLIQTLISAKHASSLFEASAHVFFWHYTYINLGIIDIEMVAQLM